MATTLRTALVIFGALFALAPRMGTASDIIPGTEEAVAPSSPASQLPRTLVVRVERDQNGKELNAVVFGSASRTPVVDERSAVALNEEVERKPGTAIVPTIKPGNSDAYWWWYYRSYPFYAYGYYPYYGYYPSYYSHYGYYWGGYYYPYSYYNYSYYYGPYAYYYYYYPY